jgi:hypothetical protein
MAECWLCGGDIIGLGHECHNHGIKLCDGCFVKSGGSYPKSKQMLCYNIAGRFTKSEERGRDIRYHIFMSHMDSCDWRDLL